MASAWHCTPSTSIYHNETSVCRMWRDALTDELRLWNECSPATGLLYDFCIAALNACPPRRDISMRLSLTPHALNSYKPSRATTSNSYLSSTSPSSPGYVSCASNLSPGLSWPTPLGVPVRIRSPSYCVSVDAC